MNKSAAYTILTVISFPLLVVHIIVLSYFQGKGFILIQGIITVNTIGLTIILIIIALLNAMKFAEEDEMRRYGVKRFNKNGN